MKETVLKVDNITKNFGKLVAVNNLSFNVHQGEVVGLVGQNGAGKSTTFKMILNFIKPDSGNIKFTFGQQPEKVLNQIGYLPEERGLYMDMTVKDQILYMANLHDYRPTKIKQELAQWLKVLDVKGNEKTLIKNLSKGNQQKIQLITALIHHPKLVILDEPFSGLDPVNIELLIQVVKQLKQNGTAIIFSSQNMRNVSEVSDTILMLVNGKRKLYSSIDQIKSSFPKNKIYLEGIAEQKFSNLTGVVKVEDDYPGKLITFDCEKNAKLAIDKVKNSTYLKGYRLLPPTLDDIFRSIIREEKNNA